MANGILEILAVKEYFGRVNSDLLKAMIDLPSLTGPILEIGCGAGKLAEAYRAARTDGVMPSYIGVELNSDAAKEASSILDNVIVGNIESNDVVTKVADLQYQLFIFGDVLEHLIDPWKTLRVLHKFSMKDAAILACIPNLQHWTLIKLLLAGHWPYADDGLLDRTHLRFFTMNSAIHMFESSGWTVQNVQGRATKKDGKDFLEMIRPAIEKLGIEIAQFERQASCAQFLITAKRSAC